jgi:hypothetical protein
MRVSEWLVDPDSEYCCMRIIEGGDANHVAIAPKRLRATRVSGLFYERAYLYFITGLFDSVCCL